ncbi:DUF4157 domain-containing protein [Roseococcus sp. SYP-B2431]|uniref:eCIS core domain-containing protein n=1 Tax=Roseococcus sp. SYP-B2431 TaxID=2496640 RepID=UPI00103B1EA9|nr:DUF4157 domain-containing protein [Roseococcus sp. SYP-B2431]TCH96825.1 DUF4157 domain-containing protein [Roseococcus sp. SYP-B2431]
MPAHGAHLPAALRDRLERSFGADLSEVRVHRCGAARRIAEDLGTIACAVDGAILLGADVPAAVLAHEVVHLLQARLPGAAPVAAAEAEARHLAARALAGLPCRVAVPADAAQPLRWEEAGHYYTVYYVALACGMSNDDAMRIAFWAQFPDEVSELDAVKAGFAMPLTGPAALAQWAGSGFGIPDALEDMYVEVNNGIAGLYGGYGRIAPPVRVDTSQFQVNLDVQRGLHCLTGANWTVETNRRTQISLGAARREDHYFEFGLSLHAYGDSFAHRNHDSGHMYASILGHGPETKFTQIAGDEISRMAGAQHPDELSTPRRREFEGCVTGMHALFRTAYPNLTPRESAGDAAAALATVIVDEPVASVQIATIRGLASRRLRTSMHSYRPERHEDVPFDDFFDEPKPVAATRHHVNEGLRLARLWNPR